MRAFVFDTETTGLLAPRLSPLHQQPRIIEFYGCTVDLNTGAIGHEIEFLCDPGVPIEPKITEITGITADDVRGKPGFLRYAPMVREAIESADAVVAHNLSYDTAMVEIEFKRNGFPGIQWPLMRICTVEETECIKGHRLSLSALHQEFFGDPHEGAHRARDDVAATVRCLLEMRKRGLV